VLDQLRGFLNRPLHDGDRPRLFAIAVAVIAGAAAILALLDDPDPAPQAPRSEALSPAQEPAAGPARSATLGATTAAPSEEGKPTAGAEPSRADIGQAKRAARRFLAGYLPYTYGRGSARRIASVSGELRDRLAGERPRVPARERRRRPRLELLQSDGVDRERARLLAMVRDGERRYTVGLELARSAAGWRVIDLGR
jgi:hypothetical protein